MAELKTPAVIEEKSVKKTKTVRKVAKKTTKKRTKKLDATASKKDGGDSPTERNEILSVADAAPSDSVSHDEKISNEVEVNTTETGSEKTSKQTITVNVSNTLKKKLAEVAADEGIDVDELAAELLGEGLVLRAWEIIERKAAMSVGTGGNQIGKNNAYQSKGGYKNQGNFKRGKKGNNGNKKNNYNRIMDDNANFLEYVRNQESRNR